MPESGNPGRTFSGSSADIKSCAAGRAGREKSVEVSIIFKIAAVGILVSMLSQVLKHSGRDEQAFLISLAGLLIVLFCHKIVL